MTDHAMMVQATLALAALASLGAVGMLYRHRERTGALALLTMMSGTALWNACLFVLGGTENPTIAALALRTAFVGAAVVSILKLVFALQYTGRERLLQLRFFVPLAVPPVLLVAFAFLDPADLFFARLEPTATGPLSIAFEFGPVVTAYYVYAYALNVAVTAFLLGFIYRSKAVYRGQSLALLAGTLAPWITVIVYIAGFTSFDMTPIGSAAAGVLFTVVIVRYRLVDITPVARDRVLDTVNDGVFVIDTADRLVDVNPEGRRMLATVGVDVDTDEVVGRRLPSLFDDPDIREQYDAATAEPEETTVHVSIGANHFEVTVTPIEDGRDRHVGWLLIAHDITERKRREQRLEEQNERLERFASLVSHDLRNPLNVADGYLELARETDDDERYLEEIAEAYDRMETIIEDVLALAREGETVTDPKPVALEAVAEAAWDGVDTGSATLTIDADGTIRADSDRLRRLLENLYRNALEHGTDDDGADLEITVASIDGADGSLEGFSVADDGAGIPADQRDRVLEDGYTTGEDGTGLGLSIVESIATAHGWTVRVEESESGGARFAFTGVERADNSAGDSGDAKTATDQSASLGP